MKKIGKILFVLFLLAITSMSCFALIACESNYTAEEMDDFISQLQQNVDKNKTDFDSKIAELEQEREAIEAELDSKIAALEQEREAIEAELDSKIADLEENYKEKDAQLKTLIEANEQAIDQLTDEYDQQIAQLIEDGEDNAKAIADFENEYRAKVEELQNNIDGALQEIQSNKTSLDNAVSDLRAEYEESLGELEDKLTELEKIVGEVEDRLGDGKIIQSVDFDADGNLEITFTDGTTQTVEAPQKHEHTFGEWIIFTRDEGINCEERLFYHICADCGGVEWRIGTESDHVSSGEYSYNSSLHWVKCLYCDEEIEHAEHIPGKDDNCTVCRQLIAPAEGVQYSLSSSRDYYEVVGYNGSAKNVVVADTYNDLPVRVIKANAFYSAEVKAVKIPDSVTGIEFYAFHGCSSLTSLILPFVGETKDGTGHTKFGYIFGAFLFTDNYLFVPTSLKSVTITSATSIGEYAFYGCSGLTSVTIGDSVTSIGEYAFCGCSSLTSVTIGDSVTSIEEYAFYGCRNLTSIILPFVGATKDGTSNTHFGYIFGADSYTNNSSYVPTSLKSVTITSATSIEARAFEGCSNLKNVTIPDSVTSIGWYAFEGCRSLTSVTIGDSVTSIGNYAFRDCRSLTSVTIPDSVTSIGYSAFEGCRSLTSVTIGDSVTSIEYYAFRDCSSLTEIRYNGTVAEWNAISKGPYWADDDYLKKVVCIDGEITL